MAASVRTWLQVTALACALLLLVWVRSADAQDGGAAAPAPSSSSPAKKLKCEPGATKPCRVGAVHDPENSEEEGLFNVKVKAPAGAADTESDDDYSDPDLPSVDDDSLIVLGH